MHRRSPGHADDIAVTQTGSDEGLSGRGVEADTVSQGSRGLARGQIFDRNGRLVASTAQEGLIRVMPDPATTRTAATKE